MKHNIPAMMIATILTLSACKDNDTAKKFQLAEQQIIQLKADLDKSRSELNKLNGELLKMRSEIPLLKTKIVPLFHKQAEFKANQKQLETARYDKSSIHYEVNTIETGIEWLDNLLYEQQIEKKFGQKINPLIPNKTRFLAILEEHYAQDHELIQQFDTQGIEYLIHTSYLGQRENIATFNIFRHYDFGGAHPFYLNEYLPIDLETKSLITLDDLFEPSKQTTVKDILWKEYLIINEVHINPQKETELYINKEDFFLAESFYFNHEGINFVYSPYSIGPYAQGEITLTIDWNNVKDLINERYIWKKVEQTKP